MGVVGSPGNPSKTWGIEEKRAYLEIHLNRASRSVLLRFPKSIIFATFSVSFLVSFLEGFWEGFGSDFGAQNRPKIYTKLGRFFDRFLKGFGVENDVNNDLNKNVKIVFSLQRESKNEGSEASQKPSKIDEEMSS